MTTATKTLPEHGTPSRARGRYHHSVPRCTCNPCRTAENRYNKQRRYLTATGQSLTTDATPAAEHLRTLFAADAGWEQLAAAIPCSKATISKLINGQQQTIRRSLADRIHQICAEDVVHERLTEPALGSIRRVRALMALGHTCKQIREISGLDRTTICELVHGRTQSILITTADRIRGTYRQLAVVAGSSVRNINRAVREGWGTPAAWDDEAIDDPEGTPDNGDSSELGRNQLAAMRRQEVAHLDGFGVAAQEIAGRLGIADSTVLNIVAELRAGTRRDRSKETAA